MNRAVRRVAVTGLGAFSPGGAGMAALQGWARGGMSTPGLVPDFDAAAHIRNPRRLRTMHRTFQLASAAAVMAMEAAGWSANGGLEAMGVAPERAGLATALADISPVTADLLRVLAAVQPEMGREPDGWARFAELGARELHPFRRLALLANMAAGHTSLLLGMQGPGFCFTSGAGGGMQAITESYWTVAEGRAELMLAQSASSPEQAYTSERLPEISGAVVLEAWEAAEGRGARVLAEIVAGGEGMPPPPAGMEPAPELLAALLRLGGGGQVELSALARAAAAQTALVEARR
ncbi:MAG: beta-ketoacyl synthase N-terminal-like domain-containing protein [Terriglobales bacterium]